MNQLFRRKSLDRLVGDTAEPTHQLKRALGPVHLTLFGVGAIVGAGIFSTVGTAAAGGADHVGAGPAIIVSFLIMAPICALAGLCYAEFASMAPVAGSAYTYAYATLGELVAWIIGWDLILEYAVGNVAVAISWSGYFQALLNHHWPDWLGVDYRSALQAFHSVAEATAKHVDLSTLDEGVLRAAQAWEHAPHLFGVPIIFNLPAFGIVALLTWLLVVGIKESAWFNSAMVVLKLMILLFFLVLGAFYVKPENWHPFAPNHFTGIAAGAAVIFFAYIGFDAVSTAAEETRNPQRDMPIGILGSLGLCTIIYVAVSVVLTGMLPASKLDTAEPLATAFVALHMKWAVAIVSLGALLANASVLLVFQMGQTRIFFSMARDGLLPPWAAKVHPKYRTPYLTTILTGLLVAAFAGLMNIDEVVDLCNIGTAFAFVLVALGVMVLRVREPDRARGFRTPWVPLVPIGAIITCGWLMTALPRVTWLRFVIWLIAGLMFYSCYSYWRSEQHGEASKFRLSKQFVAVMLALAGASSLGLTNTDPTKPSACALITAVIGCGGAVAIFSGRERGALLCNRLFLLVTGVVVLLTIAVEAEEAIGWWNSLWLAHGGGGLPAFMEKLSLALCEVLIRGGAGFVLAALACWSLELSAAQSKRRREI